MSSMNHEASPPMRIELATSQIEGGGYLSWADPHQVIACVAQAQPPETFTRFIEPSLSDLDEAGAMISSAEDGLPRRVRLILEKLKQVHTRLYRENRSPMRDSRWAKLVVASVEENRIFFVKAASCWIYRIRDGVSTRVCAEGESGSQMNDSPGLGEVGKMNLAITSLEILPNDLVVLMAALGGEAPDARSVVQPISQTQDLQRACDGLVNLLALQAPASAVVAFRFIPVAASARRELNGTSVIEDLERELVAGRDRQRPKTSIESTKPPTPHREVDSSEIPLPSFLEEAGSTTHSEVSRSEVPLPAFLEEAGSAPKGEEVPSREPDPVVPESDFRFPWEETVTESKEGPRPVEASNRPAYPEPEAREDTEVWIEAEAIEDGRSDPAPPICPESSDSSFESSPPEDHESEEPGGFPEDEAAPVRRGRSFGLWAASFGMVILLFVAVIAIPRGLEMWGGQSSESSGSGVLRIEPTPPARAIFIDGVDMQTGSPAILEGIATGVRTVRMDLGAFGTIERQVTVKDGETLDLVVQAVGSLAISSAVPRLESRAWVPGRSPQTVPCRFDSLPVGLHDVFYEDEQIPLWQREVVIRAGASHEVRINNSIASDQSHLRIESWHYRDGEGLFETVGDTVFVDQDYIGTTPWEGDVAPGFHGIRIVSAGGMRWTEVIESAGGSSRVIAPRFGMSEWPQIDHRPPGRVALQGPLLLTATVVGPEEGQPWNLRLHFPGLDATLRDLPLSAIDPAAGVYVGIVHPESIPKNRELAYYFTVETNSGQTLSSELYRLMAVNQLSQVVTP